MSSAGVKYFPLDVCLNSAIEGIENEFGIKGFAVIVKLYQRIYGQEGYYCEWNEEIMRSFAVRTCLLSEGIVSEIVASALRRGIFNKSIYETYGVLTSRGVQERYLEITSRRKSVELKKEYLLINHTQNSENADILSGNEYIFEENADISEQKKEVKELNELNKMNKKNKAAVFKFYEDNIGSINSIVAQKLKDWLNTVDESLVEYAIEQAAVNNKRNWNYIHAIINNHFKAGRKTRSDAENCEPPKSKNSKNRFDNFRQPDVDTALLEATAVKKRMKEQGIL